MSRKSCRGLMAATGMVGRLIAAVYKMFGVFITYCHTSNYDESCFCCVLNRKHVRYNPPHVQTVLYARFVLLYSLSVSGVRWDGWRAPTENTGGRKQYEQCNTFTVLSVRGAHKVFELEISLAFGKFLRKAEFDHGLHYSCKISSYTTV